MARLAVFGVSACSGRNRSNESQRTLSGTQPGILERKDRHSYCIGVLWYGGLPEGQFFPPVDRRKPFRRCDAPRKYQIQLLDSKIPMVYSIKAEKR